MHSLAHGATGFLDAGDGVGNQRELHGSNNRWRAFGPRQRVDVLVRLGQSPVQRRRTRRARRAHVRQIRAEPARDLVTVVQGRLEQRRGQKRRLTQRRGFLNHRFDASNDPRQRLSLDDRSVERLELRERVQGFLHGRGRRAGDVRERIRAHPRGRRRGTRHPSSLLRSFPRLSVQFPRLHLHERGDAGRRSFLRGGVGESIRVRSRGRRERPASRLERRRRRRPEHLALGRVQILERGFEHDVSHAHLRQGVRSSRMDTLRGGDARARSL